MKMKTYSHIIIFILIVLTMGCSAVDSGSGVVLPKSMTTGLWVSSSGDIAIALFKGGVVSVFKSGILGVCFEYGSYTVSSENTITLNSGNNHIAALTVAISEDGKKIVVESDAAHYTDTFQLKIPDTSTGDIQREIVGSWKLVDADLSVKAIDNTSYNFLGDGKIEFVSPNKSWTSTWTMIKGELVITSPEPNTKKDTILHISSLGDLIMLYDPKLPTITLLMRQK